MIYIYTIIIIIYDLEKLFWVIQVLTLNLSLTFPSLPNPGIALRLAKMFPWERIKS